MSQLTANKVRTYELDLQNNLPVKGSTLIYLGSAVGLTAGYARQLNAGDKFGGFAEQRIDNSTGTDGDLFVPVKTRGRIEAAISGLAVTDIGKPVYMSDGDTFTLTATGNTRVGTVVRFVSTGIGIVKFDATRANPLATLLTDNSSGAASDTIAAITDGPTKNAIASLAAKVNELLRAGV